MAGLVEGKTALVTGAASGIGRATALAHATRCRDFFRGGYRRFALGPHSARCFVEGGS